MKKFREHRITYDTLEEILTFANGIIENNPDMTFEDFDIEVGTDWDEHYAFLSYETSETASETNAREATEAKQRETTEYYQRQQYEALKKKFEPNV